VVETGLDLDQNSNDISPDVDLAHEKVPRDIKPGIKGKMLMVQELVRDIIDKIPDKMPIYEMRPRKSNLSIDLNKPVVEEEKGIKNGRKVKVEIKPKIEANRTWMTTTTRCKISRNKMMSQGRKYIICSNKTKLLRCNTQI
jgi:hypothetical protein